MNGEGSGALCAPSVTLWNGASVVSKTAVTATLLACPEKYMIHYTYLRGILKFFNYQTSNFEHGSCTCSSFQATEGYCNLIFSQIVCLMYYCQDIVTVSANMTKSYFC